MFAMAASRMKGHNTKQRCKAKLMLIDVKKAHLNGQCDQEHVYVQLPEEAEAPGKSPATRSARLSRRAYM